MDKTLKYLSRIGLLIGGLILFYLLVVFIGGVVQIAEAADRIYLGLGQPIFLSLLLLLVGLVASPLYIYFRFPKALVPPQESSGPEHERYMLQLRKRLTLNDRHGITINCDADVKVALEVLSGEADQVIRKTAGAVFIGTAIMQNGRLDGLISLVTQVKMVWKVACIYQQRPSPRQMIYLYSNVAGSALLAESLEDIDLSEVIAPILSAGGFSTLGVIPGVSLVVKSITDGASNAFLTLRVGCIAKQYCEATSMPMKSKVRKSATLAATRMVGGIVKDNSVLILSALKRVAVDTAKSATGKVGDAVAFGSQVVGNTAKATIDGAKFVAGNTVNVVKQGSQAVGEAVVSAGDIAKSTTGKVAGSVTRGAQVVQACIGSAIESSVQLVKGGTTRTKSLPGTTTKPFKGNAE